MEKINLHPTYETLDATHILELIRLFLDSREVSAQTLSSYTYQLELFVCWWKEYNDSRLSAFACRRFALWLETTPNKKREGHTLAYATQANALHTLRYLLRWAYRSGHISKDFTHWVPSPKGRPDELPSPSRDVVAKLMEAAECTYFPTRNRAILAMFIGTGIRRAECSALDITDISFSDEGSGTIYVRKGKGGKRRTIVFECTHQPVHFYPKYQREVDKMKNLKSNLFFVFMILGVAVVTFGVTAYLGTISPESQADLAWEYWDSSVNYGHALVDANDKFSLLDRDSSPSDLTDVVNGIHIAIDDFNQLKPPSELVHYHESLLENLQYCRDWADQIDTFKTGGIPDKGEFISLYKSCGENLQDSIDAITDFVFEKYEE